MKSPIGRAIAAAASTAIRSLGAARAALAARPPAAPRTAPGGPAARPAGAATLIRIEVSVDR